MSRNWGGLPLACCSVTKDTDSKMLLDNQTYAALNGINCERRVILTGTPIQNDLSEYFALLNFANPNYLGDRAQFRKTYELPILRGRDSDSSESEVALAEAKLKELTTKVQKFIIRRTNDLLSKYLPVKYEHVVFCAPSAFQLDLYRHFIDSPDLQKLLRGIGCQPLKMLGILRKLCNHPDLLDLAQDIPGCEKYFPDGYRCKDPKAPARPELSGKMTVLERFLHKIKTETSDKIVLISNFTQTLDVMEKMCRERRWGNLRLDGTMQITKRQKLVDRFNDPEGRSSSSFSVVRPAAAGSTSSALTASSCSTPIGIPRPTSRPSRGFGETDKRKTASSIASS